MRRGFSEKLRESQKTLSVEELGVIHDMEPEQKKVSKVTEDRIKERSDKKKFELQSSNESLGYDS